MLIFNNLRRQSREQLTRRLRINMSSRLKRGFAWLLVLVGLHVVAMVVFESLAAGRRSLVDDHYHHHSRLR